MKKENMDITGLLINTLEKVIRLFMTQEQRHESSKMIQMLLKSKAD